jgi:hypothetical protein
MVALVTSTGPPPSLRVGLPGPDANPATRLVPPPSAVRTVYCLFLHALGVRAMRYQATWSAAVATRLGINARGNGQPGMTSSTRRAEDSR